MPPDVDVAVVGAGLAGAASARALAARGMSVVVFEQFAAGHARGSSHGSARIFRRAYDDELYVGLTGRAHELWRDLEIESGREILRTTGGVDHGKRRNTEGIARRFDTANVAYELLDPAAAEERWPGMVFDDTVLFHPQAGVIDADLAVDTFLSLAHGDGAEIRREAPVSSVHARDDRAEIRLAGGIGVTARCVVISAGSWLGTLASEAAIPLPALTVTQQQYFHFLRRDDSAQWPTMVHTDRLEAYGLDSGRDTGAVTSYKIGEHDNGTITTADGRDGIVDAGSRTRISDYVREYLPGLEPEPIGEGTCLYTRTDNEDFVLARRGPIVVCSPCSGHGAKFAPLTGVLVADLVDGGPAPDPRFRLPAG